MHRYQVALVAVVAYSLAGDHTDHSLSESGRIALEDRSVEVAVHIVHIDHREFVAGVVGAVAVDERAVLGLVVEDMVLAPSEGGPVVAAQVVFVAEGVTVAVAAVDVVAEAVTEACQTIEVAPVLVVAADAGVAVVDEEVDRDIAAA